MAADATRGCLFTPSDAGALPLCLGAALSPGTSSLQESFNLYGAHPFYLVMEEGGDAHGVFLLNSNAMGRCPGGPRASLSLEEDLAGGNRWEQPERPVRELGARGSCKRERCGLMAPLLSIAICFLATARLFSNCRAV